MRWSHPGISQSDLSKDSIVAKRLDGKVFVDGKPMVDTRQTIKFFQFVTAGST